MALVDTLSRVHTSRKALLASLVQRHPVTVIRKVPSIMANFKTPHSAIYEDKSPRCILSMKACCCAYRKANNRESARRTRAKKTSRLTELEEENGQLKMQLESVQQQLGKLGVLLQGLPQISQHQRFGPHPPAALASPGVIHLRQA